MQTAMSVMQNLEAGERKQARESNAAYVHHSNKFCV